MSELFDKDKDFPSALDVAAALSDTRRMRKIEKLIENKAKSFVNTEIKDAFWELKQDLLNDKVIHNYVVKVNWPHEPDNWFKTHVKTILENKGYKIFEHFPTKDAPGSIEIFAGVDLINYSPVGNPLDTAPYHREISIFRNVRNSDDSRLFNLFGPPNKSCRVAHLKRVAEDVWEELCPLKNTAPRQISLKQYASSAEHFYWVLRDDSYKLKDLFF